MAQGTSRFEVECRHEVLILPYLGDELAMAILLPKAVDGLPAVEASLEPGAFWSSIRSAKSAQTEVMIPKFRIESLFMLKDALIAWG